MVNGGGAITLQFQRSPFRPMTRTVFVPWNQVIYGLRRGAAVAVASHAFPFSLICSQKSSRKLKPPKSFSPLDDRVAASPNAFG